MYHWTMLRVFAERPLDGKTLRFQCLEIQDGPGSVVYNCGSCLYTAVAWRSEGSITACSECRFCQSRIYVEQRIPINIPKELRFHREAFALACAPLEPGEIFSVEGVDVNRPEPERELTLTAKDKRLLKAMKIEF